MPLFGPPNIEKLKKKRDVNRLIKALGHNDSSVRSRAALALGEIGDTRALDGLVEALRYEQGEPFVRESSAEACSVRIAAATALGTMGRTEVVESLCHALDWVTANLDDLANKIADDLKRAEQMVSQLASRTALSKSDREFAQMSELLGVLHLTAFDRYREEGVAKARALRLLDEARSSTQIEAFLRVVRRVDSSKAAIPESAIATLE